MKYGRKVLLRFAGFCSILKKIVRKTKNFRFFHFYSCYYLFNSGVAGRYSFVILAEDKSAYGPDDPALASSWFSLTLQIGDNHVLTKIPPPILYTHSIPTQKKAGGHCVYNVP